MLRIISGLLWGGGHCCPQTHFLKGGLHRFSSHPRWGEEVLACCKPLFRGSEPLLPYTNWLWNPQPLKGHIHGTFTWGGALIHQRPPKVSPRVYCKRRWQTPLPQGGAWIFLPGLSVNLIHRILCFSGGPSPPRSAGEDQQSIIRMHGVVIFSLFCPLLSFCLPHLFPISFFLFLSPSLSLSYLLWNKTHTIATVIWSHFR